MPAAECFLTITAIAAPSALLTWAVRRWYSAVPWRIAFLFLVLAATFLWRGIFTSALPVPVDEAARGYPYEGVVGPVVSQNPLTNDTTRLFLPWMQVVREELRAGRAPLWNRYSFSGYPLLANGESAPFFPGFLATLIVPLPRQIVAMAGLKLFSALLFAFLLIRREGVGAAAACFGAVAFAFSTFQTVYLFYSTTAVTSLFPATIYALLNAIDRPHRRSSLILVAVMVAVLQTAGHPESVLHCALAAAGFLLIEAIAPVRPIDRAQAVAAARTIVIGTIGGLLLAAPVWIPVLEQVRLSTRFAEIAVAGRHMTPPFPGAAAYALLNPDIFGHPARGNWNWLMNYSIVASSYVGLLPLALLPLAILTRPSKAEASFSDEATGDRLEPVGRSASIRSLLSRVNHLRDRSLLLAIVAIATFIAAMNWTPLARIANSLPPLSLVANDKLRFATCLVAALCAARVAQGLQHRSRWVDGFGIAVVVGAVFVIWLKRDIVTWQSWVAVAGAAIFWLFAATARTYRTYIPHAAAIVTTIELFLLNMPFNAAAERRFYKPALPIVESLRALRSEEPFRVVGESWTLMPNASALYQLEDIRGSDPMSLGGYTSFLSLASVSEPGMDVQRIDDLGHSALDFLNVRYALAPPDCAPPPAWLEIYRGPDGKLLQNAEYLSRFFVPRNVIRRDKSIPLLEQLHRTGDLRDNVVAEGFERVDQPHAMIATRSISPTKFAITIRAERPLFVASSQPLAPGWAVSTAGKRLPLRAVNGAFIGFELPAGDHQIEVVYRPVSFYGSFALTALAVGLLWFFGRSRASLTSDSGR